MFVFFFPGNPGLVDFFGLLKLFTHVCPDYLGDLSILPRDFGKCSNWTICVYDI